MKTNMPPDEGMQNAKATWTEQQSTHIPAVSSPENKTSLVEHVNNSRLPTQGHILRGQLRFSEEERTLSLSLSLSVSLSLSLISIPHPTCRSVSHTLADIEELNPSQPPASALRRTIRSGLAGIEDPARRPGHSKDLKTEVTKTGAYDKVAAAQLPPAETHVRTTRSCQSAIDFH